VGEILTAAGVQLPMLHIGIPDRFIEHGTRDTCLARAGLDLAGLTASVDKWWSMQSQARLRSAISA
jgi:1-deoxy-D-xylulose-5-phosphate synthase